MKISRFNKDCGNSVDMNIIDGYLFDFPTNVVELQKDAADSFFTDAVTAPEEFKKRILLSTTIGDEEKERYFLVGDIAASQQLANNHINRLHNKITSRIPYLAHIDKLRKEKFPELFTDLRAFDQFILDNYSKQKFELKNENTGESI